jgi:3-oxoacyl-[acyl-carrier-protein] synthase III
VNLTHTLPDTHSTSLFLAVHEVLTTRSPARGTRGLLLCFGAGLTVGAATYRF